MASSATLTSLIARVRAVLMDSGASIWSDSDLTEALRQAVAEYSRARPLFVDGEMSLIASGREISLAADFAGLVDVREVWVPYFASDAEAVEYRRAFDFWPDSVKVYVRGDYVPQAGDEVRVFYTKLQTLNGLDSAVATTFSAEDDTLLVTGAAGFATTTRGIDLAEKITLDKITSQQVRAWGLGKLQEFRAALRDVARRQAGRGSSRVPVGKLDEWDRLRGQSGKKWS